MTWACVRHCEFPQGPQICHLRALRLVRCSSSSRTIGSLSLTPMSRSRNRSQCADPRRERGGPAALLMDRFQALLPRIDLQKMAALAAKAIQTKRPPCGGRGGLTHRLGVKDTVRLAKV